MDENNTFLYIGMENEDGVTNKINSFTWSKQGCLCGLKYTVFTSLRGSQ